MNFTYQNEHSKPQLNVYNSTAFGCNNDYSSSCHNGVCTDPLGYTLFDQPWCGCGACEQNCTSPDFSQYIQARTLSSGFHGVTVLIVFGVV